MGVVAAAAATWAVKPVMSPVMQFAAPPISLTRHHSASIEQMLQMRKFRRAQQGIELEKLNRGEGKKKKKGPIEIELDQFGLQPSAAGLRKEKEAEPTTESERAAHKVRSNNFTQQTNALDVDKHMWVARRCAGN